MVLLCVAQLHYVFTPPPATILLVALGAEAIYATTAILAYQVDTRL